MQQSPIAAQQPTAGEYGCRLFISIGSVFLLFTFSSSVNLLIESCSPW